MTVCLFATQGGTSQEFAEKFAEVLGCETVDAKDVPAEDLAKYTKIIWSVSSYGRGLAPKEYREWWQSVEDWQGDLSNTKFAVFTCGSSNYKKTFAGFGKTVEARMNALGAKEICPMGINDEAEEQSTDLDEFIKGIKE